MDEGTKKCCVNISDGQALLVESCRIMARALVLFLTQTLLEGVADTFPLSEGLNLNELNIHLVRKQVFA